jgi:hypothetical protein
MPNAAAKLVVDHLFWRGVLCFEVGVRGDVLRRFFGRKDFFGKQIKDGEMKTRESKKQVRRKLTLEWCVSLGYCLP